MEINAYDLEAKRDLGEFSNLEKAFYPKQDKTKTVIVAGIDGGSTGTRILILDKDDTRKPESLDKVYSIPSQYTELKDSYEIKPQSDSLYENMDSRITKTDGTAWESSRLRIIRGTKKIDANIGETRINTSTQKIKSDAFYINIIDALGYSLIQKYDILSEEYDIYVGCSLRPDDIANKKNREEFNNKLVGSYTWTNKDLGVTLRLNIKGVEAQTEPEAAVKGHYLKIKKKVPPCVMLIEGGGSSIGVEILQGPTRFTTGSKTLAYGGSRLQQEVEKEYLDAEGGGNLRANQLDLVLRTGSLKIGRGSKNMVEYVVAAKDTIAELIFKDVKSKVFDIQGEIAITDIETVLYSGGLFREGKFMENIRENANNIEGYSIASPLTELFMKENPNAEFSTITTNLIPFGNAINSMKLFGGYLMKQD